jgi:hypothetical protein
MPRDIALAAAGRRRRCARGAVSGAAALNLKRLSATGGLMEVLY